MKLGITGHQRLEQYDSKWIESAINNFLSENKVTEGFTCLAAGADQLFARLLERRNIPFSAVIPCKEYETTFREQGDLFAYQRLEKQAAQLYFLPFEHPSEQAFFEAGKEIVAHSDRILAIWDGKKAQGLGGTADIVAEALQQFKPVVHLNPVTQTIQQLTHD